MIFNIMNKININLSHVFLHFFEIGGGEKYLYRFQKYSQFNEAIYVKKIILHQLSNLKILFIMNLMKS